MSRKAIVTNVPVRPSLEGGTGGLQLPEGQQRWAQVHPTAGLDPSAQRKSSRGLSHADPATEAPHQRTQGPRLQALHAHPWKGVEAVGSGGGRLCGVGCGR